MSRASRPTAFPVAMLTDEVILTVRGGSGGRGAVSFRREKAAPLGGPDGGDGGHGGDVVFVADENLNSLHGLRRRPQWAAESGEAGRRSNCRGRNGADLLVPVPVGTLIHDAATGALLKDLARHDQRIVIAAGGKGGRGNKRFATAQRQTPRRAENGQPGETRRLRLELKLIADVGVVGLPNAGKSTLLARLSRARPKIANYPFTTLAPNLGVVEVDEFHSFVAADLPGLIEGAHEGIGLGDKFLRHVERTRAILHLVDVSEFAALPPDEAYRVIRAEMTAYSEGLAQKPEVVVANKIDLGGTKAGLKRLKTVADVACEISAATGKNVPALVKVLARLLKGGYTSEDSQPGTPRRR